jgi:hypothetical protein
MNCPAITFEPSAGIFAFTDSAAVSDEAHSIQKLFQKTRQDLWSSVSLGYSRDACRNQLIDAWQEAARTGWDGYDAEPVHTAAVINAYAFIDAFPSNIPLPEVAVDPDGEISFDWFSAPRRQFSISIGPNNVLSYAGLFGADKVSGSERFQGTVPKTFVDYITRVAA